MEKSCGTPVARLDPEYCCHFSFVRFAEAAGLSSGTYSWGGESSLLTSGGRELYGPWHSRCPPAFSQRGQEQVTGGVTWLPPAIVLLMRGWGVSGEEQVWT